jgi:hypothetical protein
MINVFSVLGVAGNPRPFVGHLGMLASLGDDEFKANNEGRNRSDAMEAFVRAVEVRITLLIGV